MISVIIFWVCFSQHVNSNVIIINNSGTNATSCCKNGTCLCNSLYTALMFIESNTIINITSESILLEEDTYVGLQYLDNVTIKGDNVVVMCNNKGRMSWRSGNNILIEGITWDQCGDPRHPGFPAIEFDNVYHITIINCTFQHSKVCRTVNLLLANKNDASTAVNVVNSRFIFNKLESASACTVNQASLTVWDYPFKPTIYPKIIISQSVFYSNGNTDVLKRERTSASTALYCSVTLPLTLNILIEHSTFLLTRCWECLLIAEQFLAPV